MTVRMGLNLRLELTSLVIKHIRSVLTVVSSVLIMEWQSFFRVSCLLFCKL